MKLKNPDKSCTNLNKINQTQALFQNLKMQH